MDSRALNIYDHVTKPVGAFLGAAVGDALGWPQEGRAVVGRHLDRATGFQQWTKRSGGRFYSHEEVIERGEYSDDTQLILCTARSLKAGPRWWKRLTGTELPAWSVYERGGGAATKRAVRRWLNGQRPWASELSRDERALYFGAGGNGVAMRILPHAVARARSDDFALLAHDILANGISTHGHPRALLGALLYGYCVWQALKSRGTLEYGALIENALSSASVWSDLPPLNDFEDWLNAAELALGGGYERLWRATTREVITILEESRKAMKQGALFVDHEFLAAIGCFDHSMSGAGTVTAVASIFMASRYAADPIHGVLEAAFAHGADTDTLASMSGGLLGAALGNEWLQVYSDEVQDRQYLRELAAAVVSEVVDVPADKVGDSVRPSDIDEFLQNLANARPEADLRFVDGRSVRVAAKQSHVTRSSKVSAVSWRLLTNDGQAVYVKKISRDSRSATSGRYEAAGQGGGRGRDGSLSRRRIVTRIGFKLYVADLSRALAFYQRLFELPVTRVSERRADLSGAIALVVSEGVIEHGSPPATICRPTLCVETRSIESVYAAALEANVRILSDLRATAGRKSFKCYDPDSNVVEVVQARGDGDTVPVN